MEPPGLSLIYYDPVQRRVWIAGQRWHHGATGLLLTTVAVGSIVVVRLRPRGVATLAAAGSLLMAHDWKDRSVWFARGWQDE